MSLLQTSPVYERKFIKNFEHTRDELYINGILYSVCTTFIQRRDAFSNIYDKFGNRIQPKKVRKEIKYFQRIDSDTLTAIWGFSYILSMMFPLVIVYQGWIKFKEIWLFMIPAFISIGLFIIINHEKWEYKITHYKKECLIEDDG